MQEGYDPSGYYDVANLYSLLCPVVFTGNSCSVKGGGAICVKPVGGVYTPPSNASSNLRYIGVTRNPVSQEHRPGDVDMNGTVNSADALIALRAALGSMTLTQAQFELADMDGNGVIDSRDALIILRMALGLR